MQKSIVTGDENGNFNPDKNITRAEFVTLVSKVMNIEDTKEFSFADVPDNAWYKEYLKKVVGAGLISDDEYFRPNDSITREEMTKIIVCGYRNKTGDTKEYPVQQIEDSDLISSWAKEYVYTAYSLGIVNGVTSTQFAPKENATKAQAAAIIKNFISIVEK